ncbi:type II toxin-antitoxin system RelE family toxin [Synechocystis sp. CACIAM 05]|uniref:type II toxin-antitoxin system RelE family toxin n=1 Tax=Synechocystis sp. CACIAM 05 TaxID=1933929 RepID=UPI00300C2499
MYSKIIERISELANEPRPAGTKKLTGTASEYRIRIGNYRVRYEIDDKAQLIII